MSSPAVLFNTYLTASAFWTPLPGPSRKRAVAPYLYRVTYCSPEPLDAGCAVTWEVRGGRMPYQVVLEREDNGSLRWHCTCADAVYRGEVEGRHCKHVKGLLATGRPRGEEANHRGTESQRREKKAG